MRPTPYFGLKETSRLGYANYSACQKLKYDQEEILSCSIFDITTDLSKQQWSNIWEESKKHNHVTSEAFYQTRFGKNFPVEIVFNYLMHDGQEYLFSFVRDCTERNEAEKARIELETQLQRFEKMKAIGTVAGGVAHDLNNILSGIVSYPELLLMKLSDDDPMCKPLQTIQKTGVKATAIVQDLLTMSRRGGYRQGSNSA